MLHAPAVRPLMALAALICCVAQLSAAEPFEVKAGDRVVLIGDTWFEREGVAAALESRIYQRWAPRAFSVRNLSFAADRPDGVSRASFDPPAAGFKRLQEQLALVKPTVAIIGYGMAAALEEITYRTNDWALNPDTARYGNDFTAARFQKDLLQLLDAINTAGGAPVRIVLVAPIRPEDLRATRPRLPDPAALRQVLAGYHAAIAAVAKERGARFVDTPALVPATATLTFNSIHPTAAGLEQWADAVGGDLGWTSGGERKWNAAQITALRSTLVRKNDLFFHRWRPANHTYIFGFRKHEQGKNAVEMPQFDSLLDQADAALAKLVAGGEPEPLPAKTAPTPINTAAPAPDFKLGDGLSIDLWGANPLISKPLHMMWDTSGRLWVASTPMYPQIQPGAVASDRIFVVEDTDHDGKADRSTVFADDLLLPDTVAPVERVDGKFEAYVGASTDLLLLSDTDGDGKADTRRAVLSGFGTEDTHHTIHTLYWGRDGRLSFNQSIYIHTHLETPWGVVRLNSGGSFAYDTASERVEILMRGLCNSWGHQMDAEGQSFFTDGCGGGGLTWGLRGGAFNNYENAKSIAPSVSKGGYPKFCGLELVQSPLFPADWQGDAITCDFRAHRMVRMNINRLDGKSGFVTNDEQDLLKTADAWFRPIDVKHGPDGALYLVDWTNPVINHGEVDFRDERRDHVHGRIWRMAPTASKPLTWKPMHGRPVPELCQALLSDNKWERESARWVLASLAADKAGDAAEQQALAWLNALKDQAAKDRALSDLLYAFRSSSRQALANLPAATASAGGRTLLVRAIGPHDPQAKRLDQLCNLALTSGTPRDLLEVIQALARMPNTANATWLLRLLPRAPKDDVYFDFALRGSLAALSKPLLDALEAGGLAALNDPQVSEAAVVMALQMLPADRVGKAVGGLLNGADRNLASDALGPLVAHAGDAKTVARLFATLGSPAAAGHEANVLRWCGDAAARGVVVSDEKPPLASLLAHADAGIRAQAVRLAGLWKRADLVPAIRTAAADAAVRKEALAALQAIGGEPAVGALKTLLSESTTAPARAEIITVLAKVDGAQAIAAATPLLKSAATDNEAGALWRGLWAGNGVIERVVKTGLPADLPALAIAAGLTTTKELGGRGTKLMEMFKAGQAAPAASATPIPTGDKPVDLAAWVALTTRDGNPGKGEARYFGLNCQTCHTIGGAGGKLGPDLSTLGASAPLDYIIESVLKPAEKVKEGYHSVTFKMKDGSQVIGILASETDKEVIVRMPGLEQSLAKDAIVSREITAGSLMPVGLADLLPAEDQAHLFAFLAQIGKPGLFDASDGKVARVLRLSGSLPEGVAPDLTKMAPAFANIDGRMMPRSWRAPLATVDGTGTVYAMAQVDMPVAGLLTITVDGQSRPWLDGIRLDPQETGKMVAAGRHTIAVSITREKLPTDLRIRVSAGRFVTP